MSIKSKGVHLQHEGKKFLFAFLNSFFFPAALRGTWDLKFPNLGLGQSPAVKVLGPNHWTAKEFPVIFLKWLKAECFLIGRKGAKRRVWDSV